MNLRALLVLVLLTTGFFGCGQSAEESEEAAQSSTSTTTQKFGSFDEQVAEYIQKFSYQDTFNYVMRYTGGDPKNFNTWVPGLKRFK